MRRVSWAVAVSASLGASLAAFAQDDPPAQTLTVWIVRPVTSGDRAVLRAQKDLRDISVYRESTAGSFGKPASEVGQTAGSYGKPASEAGQNAGDVGVTAGSYGQTASSLPSNVTSQTAGSYGQTAGSYGTAASDFTGAPPKGSAAATDNSTASRESKGGQWTAFVSDLQKAFPHIQVRVAEVYGVDLRQRLAALAGTSLAPDVLLSDRMPDGWANASRGSLLAALAPGGADHRRQTVFHDAIGLASAPHPLAAREFLEWWYGQDLAPGLRNERATGKLTPPMAVALSAVAQVLSGSALDGLADNDMAPFSGLATRAEALHGSDPLPADLGFRTDVVRAVNNDRFAAVLLHTQCASRTAYCDLYPVVLLRANARGEWKVLQFSLEMDASHAAQSFQVSSASARPAATLAQVAMPKLASPPDGDQRAAQSGLDLWWDNGGGGAVLAVEWQTGGGGRNAPASHIELVDDTDAKLQTRVPAPFTNASGPVRWRVWALGQGGVLRLTEWRTVNMLQ